MITEQRPFALSPLLSPPSVAALGGHLVSVAAEFFDIDPQDVFSRRKHGEITAARRSVAYVLVNEAGWEAARVARFFQQKHPSILSGLAAANRLLREDIVFFTAVERLKDEIYGNS